LNISDILLTIIFIVFFSSSSIFISFTIVSSNFVTITSVLILIMFIRIIFIIWWDLFYSIIIRFLIIS
jgi:hypothetical protein